MVARHAKELAIQRDTIENEALSKTQTLREQLMAKDSQRDK
jgi:hypothetical protein